MWGPSCIEGAKEAEPNDREYNKEASDFFLLLLLINFVLQFSCAP